MRCAPWSVGLSLFALACGSDAPVEPVEVPAPVVPAETEAAPIAACRAAHCAEADETCMADNCAVTLPSYTAGIRKVRFEEHSLFIELSPELIPGSVGDTPWERTEPLFVGVTAVTPEGVEIDLIVQTLFPAAEPSPIIFAAEVGADVEVVLVGMWDRKVEPCEVDRYGCETFGFVLDDNLATWPPNVYETGHRQRLWTEAPTVRMVVPRDLDRSARRRAQAAIEAPIAELAELFGQELDPELQDGIAVATPEVRYRHAQDAYVAYQITAAVQALTGSEPRVRHLPNGMDVDLEIVTGAIASE